MIYQTIKQVFRAVYGCFLGAIDHMECQPTLMNTKIHTDINDRFCTILIDNLKISILQRRTT